MRRVGSATRACVVRRRSRRRRCRRHRRRRHPSPRLADGTYLPDEWARRSISIWAPARDWRTGGAPVPTPAAYRVRPRKIFHAVRSPPLYRYRCPDPHRDPKGGIGDGIGGKGTTGRNGRRRRRRHATAVPRRAHVTEPRDRSKRIYAHAAPVLRHDDRRYCSQRSYLSVDYQTSSSTPASIRSGSPTRVTGQHVGLSSGRHATSRHPPVNRTTASSTFRRSTPSARVVPPFRRRQ